MTPEDMTLEELLEMLKSGKVGNINSYYMGMFIRYLEELKVTRKALDMACNNLILEEIANDSHCGESVEELENMYLELAREKDEHRR